MTTRPELTISEAAEACSVSPKTIRRRLKAGEFPGAHQDGSGENAPWLIPIEALEVADGLTPNAPSGPDEPELPEPVPNVTDALNELTERLNQAEADAVEWRRRAEVAEAIAEERSAALGDLRTALNMAQRQLMAAEPTPLAESSDEPAPPHEASEMVEKGRVRAAWSVLRGRR